MLYVFLVDVGAMYTFEMEMAMESVETLMGSIASSAGIPVDKQVLLICGGEALDPNDRVCNYSNAGTDTSPIYLFSKSTIESSVPPSPSLNLGSEASLKEQAEISFKLPPTYETLVSRAQLAAEFHHYALEIAQSCDCLISEQKFQQLGWGAVVANLESISREFNDRAVSVQQSYAEFLESRPRYQEMLSSFKEMLPLLGKIPVLHCLLSSQHQQLNWPQMVDGITLLDWISAQDNKYSLQDMVTQCQAAVEQFDQTVLEDVLTEVNQVQEALENESMKEIKGLEERLEGLQQLLQKVQELVQSQSDMAQGFLQNQTRAQNIGDPSVLPDLCASHQKQLMMLLKNHSQLRDFRRRSARAKDELSINLHTRLRWIMYVEKKVCDCDSTLIIYHENIRRIKRRLDILEQVEEAPKLYILAVAEVVRRRSFSSQYYKWALKLHESAAQTHAEELARREDFAELFGRHFLHAMFTGMEDRPPKLFDKPPKEFDQRLPIITENDLQQLQTSVPELSEYLDKSYDANNISMLDVTLSTTPITSETQSASAATSMSRCVCTMSVDTQDDGESGVADGKEMHISMGKGTDMSVVQEPTDDTAHIVLAPSDAEEPAKECSSQSEAGSDSDLMFRSAQEDYVTVAEADLGKEFTEEQSLSVEDQVLGSHNTSQTLTLTSSGSQSCETSTQTDDGLENKADDESASEESTPVQQEEQPATIETTDAPSMNKIIQLEEQLQFYKKELNSVTMEKEKIKNDNFQTGNLFGETLTNLRENLSQTRQMVIDSRTQFKHEIVEALEKLSSTLEKASELTQERTSKEYKKILREVTDKYDKEKKHLLEEKTHCEIEKNDVEIKLQSVMAEKEALEIQHKDKVEELNSSLGILQTHFEEQKSLAMKLKETKERSEEDQQTRFNAIIMRLKRERDQMVGQLNEKLTMLEGEYEKQQQHLEVLEQEKVALQQTKEEDSMKFTKKEKELLTALSCTEAKLHEIQSTVEEREREFEGQLQKEKASALLLLEVERQMWEAEHLKESSMEVDEASGGIVTQNYQEKIRQLEQENKILSTKLANQTDVLSKTVMDFEESEINPVIAQAKQALQDKDEQIKHLQQQMEQQQGTAGSVPRNDKVSLKDFQSGDLILLVFDPRYENYLVFSTASALYFLHPDSMAMLDIATTGPKRRDWSLAILTDREYCQAKKANNRFHVPVGTKFYRIQAKPWEK
ncbi:RB1-inducible coiled-coil protein 1 [Nematostella vectensis]|uniref:RB1-inducible coiled-coil protein 1 n=1 Tax=Nematostella vectensis TaxID=45351 RepID=UPI002077536E|nr:RB1-inducible coiled-coil protein 1 [Nematostella vectensis]